MDYDRDPSTDDAMNEGHDLDVDTGQPDIARTFKTWWETASSYRRVDVSDAADLYEEADRLLEANDEIDVAYAETLPVTYQDEPDHDRIGIFLSAVYNHSDETSFTYSTETPEPLAWLGWELDDGKELTVETPVQDLGHSAEGRINVQTDLEDETGLDVFFSGDLYNEKEVETKATGPRTMINDGSLEMLMPNGSGIAINRGHVDATPNQRDGLFINHGTTESPLGYHQSPMNPEIPQLDPTGITIDYADADRPAEEYGIYIDAGDTTQVYYGGQPYLSEDEDPDHPLWDYLDELEAITLQAPDAVFSSLATFDDPGWDAYDDEPREVNIFNPARFDIGHTIEQLLEN